MIINHSIDALVPKVVYEFFNLIQVSLIVNARRGFDSFPHHAQSDQVHTPGFEILDVRGADRVLELICRNIIHVWDIRVDLVNGVYSMEKELSAFLVPDYFSFWIYVNTLIFGGVLL